jgi:F0F1-type ATP synthase delta subunit
MTIAEQYARALHSLAEEHPEHSAAYLQNMQQALAARGHHALLPKVFAAYRGLMLAAKRSQAHQRVTPAQRRTQALLQLYKKLIAAS